MRSRFSSLRRSLLTIGGLAVIAALAAFGYTKRLTVTAETFLQAVRQNQLGQAHNLLSTSLREHKEEAWLRQLLEETGLLGAKEAEWSEPKIEGGYGQLTGSLTEPSGEKVPVTMLFVREQFDWRLYAIKRPFVGELPQVIEPPVPNRTEQIALVRRAMHDFAASVQCRDMSYFHSTLAPAKRAQVTSEKLDEAFGRFFDIEEDLASLDEITPQMAAGPEPSHSGEVILSGYFPTAPKAVHFEQKYCFEKNDWRLLSFKISMR